MVTIRQVEFQFDNNQNILPVMHIHSLTALKDTRQFKEGQKIDLHVCKMTDGRYQLFRPLKDYKLEDVHEVFTEKELHESFSEA